MTDHIVETACRLAGTVSDWNRYVRVNDHVVDTIERRVVATAWPRMAPNAFPIRHAGESVLEALS